MRQSIRPRGTYHVVRLSVRVPLPTSAAGLVRPQAAAHARRTRGRDFTDRNDPRTGTGPAGPGPVRGDF